MLVFIDLYIKTSKTQHAKAYVILSFVDSIGDIVGKEI